MNAVVVARLARSTVRFALLALGLVTLPTHAAVINVAPGDSYTKMEAAQPGDEVVIAPGTYAFRVYLTKQATPAHPIVIRAQDPANPPVWDFGTTLVENASGSYSAGDRGRGGWQFSGAKNYSVSGIVFRNCRTASLNAGGIRYYNGTTNLYLKDCVFTQNDNGLTGGSHPCPSLPPGVKPAYPPPPTPSLPTAVPGPTRAGDQRLWMAPLAINRAINSCGVMGRGL